MSEGFINARALAHKFVTLYSLCNALLSKATHYDWGLRAVKAVLRQAGALKRADTALDEDVLLMRALRDFNIAKITTQDLCLPVSGLFCVRRRDVYGEELPNDHDPVLTEHRCSLLSFCLRRPLSTCLCTSVCVYNQGSLNFHQELLYIYIYTYIYIYMGIYFAADKPVFLRLIDDLFPGLQAPSKRDANFWKVVTQVTKQQKLQPEEQFVLKCVQLREILSVSNISSCFVISVLVLTLVSNERIPFTNTMRMLFEIADMKHASPATVSRGGVLFINETDVGWKPYLESWRETLPDQIAQSQFYLLFSYYFEQFPEGGLCFDYYFDQASCQWCGWSQLLRPYEPAPDTLYSHLIVPTVDSVRLNYVVDLRVRRRKPVLIVGSTGSGKTTLVHGFLRGLPEEIVSTTIHLNSYTDSRTLQRLVENNVEKRTGHSYGPAGNKRIIFYIDDFNMPSPDKYDTQAPLELLRQLIDYGSMFDRDHLDERKHIVDVQYIASMNPTAGSFNISSRLQRHFSVLTCFYPDAETFTRIFGSILRHHLLPFDPVVQALEMPLVQATIDVFQAIQSCPMFLHSAKKFHYNFSLRDFSLIFQGGFCCVFSASDSAAGTGTTKFVRLWLHECCRVIRDRLINSTDAAAFDEILEKVAKKSFQEEKADALFEKPNVMTSFVSESGGNDRVYLPVKDMDQLKQVLDEKLAEYSQMYVEMPLVLFDDAMEHVARISRVIDQPGGNALLVGVGGSGKQSLSRLASFISKMEVFQIMVNQHYDKVAFKTDLQVRNKTDCLFPFSLPIYLSKWPDETVFLVFFRSVVSLGRGLNT
ncbi:UNVERIFIED_CONTAM: hypothetical protein H355_012866 [Colinus virginianus]|nr:hypothetical protein H355_012866 [Colinus virginianus]